MRAAADYGCCGEMEFVMQLTGDWARVKPQSLGTRVAGWTLAECLPSQASIKVVELLIAQGR